uniref:Uncharacterized protein n=1 Tax=Amphilophus citrinellus TaxID=61819 RepID=A0A3Q0T6J1_AMPCI
MGDNMSKRLKLISATEAEMEERSFSNPYPDWDQGVVTSNSGADVVCDDPSDGEGNVRSCFFALHILIFTSADVLIESRASLAQVCHYLLLLLLLWRYVTLKGIG